MARFVMLIVRLSEVAMPAVALALVLATLAFGANGGPADPDPFRWK